MTNHVRTLLLNLSGDIGVADGYPGEEYVPPAYRPVTLSGAETTVRRLLFGGTPDRAMMNYRLRELLTIIHGTEMAEFVLALDPRVTYWPLRSGLGWDTGTTVRQFAGTASSLSLVSSPVPQEHFGRLYNEWQVTITDSTEVTVVYYDIVMQSTRSELFTVGTAFTLPGSSLQILVQGSTGAGWTVQALARPSQGLTDLAASVDLGLSVDALNELFGRTPDEPYRTFRNLWLTHPQTLYRLGGLTLALAYRTNEIWEG